MTYAAVNRQLLKEAVNDTQAEVLSVGVSGGLSVAKACQ